MDGKKSDVQWEGSSGQGGWLERWPGWIVREVPMVGMHDNNDLVIEKTLGMVVGGI